MVLNWLSIFNHDDAKCVRNISGLGEYGQFTPVFSVQLSESTLKSTEFTCTSATQERPGLVNSMSAPSIYVSIRNMWLANRVFTTGYLIP